MRFSFRPKPQSIDDVMAGHRAAVLSGEEKALQRMIRAYRAAERGINAKLERVQYLLAVALDEGGTGEEIGTFLYQNKRYIALLDEINAQIDKFASTAENITKSQQSANALRGAANALALMKAETKLAAIKIDSAFISLNKEAVLHMAGVFADGSPLRTLFNEFGKEARGKAHDVMVSGIASGESPRQIGKTLHRSIEDLSLNRATRIARNESLRVLTTAQKTTYDLNSDVILGSRIVATLDSRTCPMCWARHGTILKPGEPFNRHVTCRCALAPITVFSPDRANGEEEFELLPEDEKAYILGPARYELYQNRQLKLSDLYVETSSRWGPGLKYNKLSQIPKRAEGSVQVPHVKDGATSVIQERKRRGIVAK